ncbi:hypothetical protein [Micromonospora echinospora]|nr:hypothetical protein [Micromonospora echinospora]
MIANDPDRNSGSARQKMRAKHSKDGVRRATLPGEHSIWVMM